MEYLNNNEEYLKAIEFLKTQIILKGYNWDTARMKPIDSELYVNKQIEVGGTVNLLTGATVQERGVTNFDGNRLEKGRVFVINGLSVAIAEGKSTDLPQNIKFEPINSTLDKPFLRFANVVMKQKDEVIFKLPLSAFFNANGTASADYYRALGALALIEDEAQVDLSIEFPQGVTAKPTTAGNVFFVSVSIKGFETYLKR